MDSAGQKNCQPFAMITLFCASRPKQQEFTFMIMKNGSDEKKKHEAHKKLSEMFHSISDNDKKKYSKCHTTFNALWIGSFVYRTSFCTATVTESCCCFEGTGMISYAGKVLNSAQLLQKANVVAGQMEERKHKCKKARTIEYLWS